MIYYIQEVKHELPEGVRDMQWITYLILLATAVLNYRTARINNETAKMNQKKKDADRGNGQHQG